MQNNIEQSREYGDTRSQSIRKISEIAYESARHEPAFKSDERFQACFLMALYPHAETLENIANMAQVGMDTLSRWMTEELFVSDMNDAFASIGIKLVDELESHVCNLKYEIGCSADCMPEGVHGILGILPFLNHRVTDHFIHELIDRAREGRPELLDVLRGFPKSTIHIKDEERRVLESRPEILLVAKAGIFHQIEELTNSSVDNESDEADYERMATKFIELVRNIFDKLDALAGGGEKRELHSDGLMDTMLRPFKTQG